MSQSKSMSVQKNKRKIVHPCFTNTTLNQLTLYDIIRVLLIGLYNELMVKLYLKRIDRFG